MSLALRRIILRFPKTMAYLAMSEAREPEPTYPQPRPYEIEVLDISGGYGWAILVDGEVIAMNDQHRHTFPREAHGAAEHWCYIHEALGYDFRPNWWETH